MSLNLKNPLKIANGLAHLRGLSSLSSADVDTEYEKFFRGKLAEWEVKSPSEIPEDKRKMFFSEVKADWEARKHARGIQED